MDIKIFDSELKIMEIVWEEGAVSAKHIADLLKEQVGWSKTTTYTVIKKCLDKGILKREDPGFLCSPLISREQACENETNELINKMYNGSADRLVASLLGRKTLSVLEIERLKSLVSGLEETKQSADPQ